ncbi:MAG: phenylacetate--CoA ligase family protein [Candidatus Freyarchaeota archaeon]
MHVDRNSGMWNPQEETISREEKRLRDERLLVRIFRHAYSNSPFYRERFRKAGLTPEDVKTLEDIEKIPFLRKPELQEAQRRNPPFGNNLTVPLNKLSEIFVSPGPIYEGVIAEEAEAMLNARCKAFYSCGARPGDIVVNTFMYHMVPAGLSIHLGFRRLGCTVVPTGVGQTVYQAIIMRDLEATVFAGTPSFLGMIGEKARENGVDLKRDLKLELGIFSAEPLPESLRKRLMDVFGIYARQIFGTADLGTVARECPEERGMHLEESLITEMIDPDTLERVAPGEEGEITCTMPHKLASPIIRFRTGDATILSEEKCSCRRTSPRIMKILGRVDQLVKVKGMFVHPVNIKSVIRKHPELGNYEAVVDRPHLSDVLTIRIEYEGTGQSLPRDPNDAKKELEREFKEALRIKARVELLGKGSLTETREEIVDLRKM